jgi:hypothetical protein
MVGSFTFKLDGYMRFSEGFTEKLDVKRGNPPNTRHHSGEAGPSFGAGGS